MYQFFSRVDFASLRFGDPKALWLVIVPGFGFLLWIWRLAQYRSTASRFRAQRYVPIREKFPLFGGLLFWLAIIIASILSIAALSRPSILGPPIDTSGLDLIVLQDGSASMHVMDVAGDRWQRSMRFLRVVADSLHWTNDRIALAVFAHIAAPQVRLTKDPNTFFFFLDHLDQQSPFPLADNTTWDTNIELGIHWGVRVFDKDRELHGKSPNPAAFVLISDGQAWSGKVDNAIKEARIRNIPIYVVGVGTTRGGTIPAPPEQLLHPVGSPSEPYRPIHASLDRASLLKIADAGGGQYMEIDRETDRDIALHLINATRREAHSRSTERTGQDVYWAFLVAAACVLVLGISAAQDRSELLLHTAGATLALAALWFLVK